MIVVSYATPEFSEAAERLVESCDALRLNYRISHFNSTGKWFQNVCRKPMVIAAAVSDHPEVLWVDADAEICRKPTIFKDVKHFDFACTSRERRPREEEAVTIAYRTGTMAFRRTDAAKRLLRRWVAMVLRAKSNHGQEPLLYEAHQMTDSCVRHELPGEYLAVQGRRGWWFPGDDRRWDDVPPEAIVAHHRSVRMNRR